MSNVLEKKKKKMNDGGNKFKNSIYLDNKSLVGSKVWLVLTVKCTWLGFLFTQG